MVSGASGPGGGTTGTSGPSGCGGSSGGTLIGGACGLGGVSGGVPGAISGGNRMGGISVGGSSGCGGTGASGFGVGSSGSGGIPGCEPKSLIIFLRVIKNQRRAALWVSSLLPHGGTAAPRSEEHTSELQSLMRISYAVFCLKKKKKTHNT